MPGMDFLMPLLALGTSGLSLFDASKQDERAERQHQAQLKHWAEQESREREDRLKSQQWDKIARWQSGVVVKGEEDAYRDWLASTRFMNPAMWAMTLGSLAHKLRRRKLKRSAPTPLANEMPEEDIWGPMAQTLMFHNMPQAVNPAMLQTLMYSNMLQRSTPRPQAPITSTFSNVAPLLYSLGARFNDAWR